MLRRFYVGSSVRCLGRTSISPGPSFTNGSAYDEIPSGETGVAVRTLVQLVRDMTS